jgi:transaldolase
MIERISESKEYLSRISKLGINLSEVTQELERDGIEKFIDSWKALIELVKAEK